MDWTELRAATREAVHSVFSQAATYEPPSPPGGYTATYALLHGSQSVNPISITVRLHTNIETFGDLDREGYAQQAEDVNQMVFLSAEVQPARGGKVTLSSGETYQIRMVLPDDGPVEKRCTVARLKTP